MRRKIVTILASLLAAGVLLFFVLFIIGGGIISGTLFNPRIGREQMERIFVEDYNLLVIVANYFAEFESTSIRLSSGEDMGLRFEFSDNYGRQHIPIEDEDVVNALNELKTRGYKSISKSNNLVAFIRWSSMSRSRGIAFAIGGFPEEDILPFFTMMIPLSRESWFFYEQE